MKLVIYFLFFIFLSSFVFAFDSSSAAFVVVPVVGSGGSLSSTHFSTFASVDFVGGIVESDDFLVSFGDYQLLVSSPSAVIDSDPSGGVSGGGGSSVPVVVSPDAELSSCPVLNTSSLSLSDTVLSASFVLSGVSYDLDPVVIVGERVAPYLQVQNSRFVGDIYSFDLLFDRSLVSGSLSVSDFVEVRIVNCSPFVVPLIIDSSGGFFNGDDPLRSRVVSLLSIPSGSSVLLSGVPLYVLLFLFFVLFLFLVRGMWSSFSFFGWFVAIAVGLFVSFILSFLTRYLFNFLGW